MGLVGLMGLMGCNDIATGLTAGEGQVAAVEGEGVPSDEQKEDPTGQSGRDGVDADNFGLEIDGGRVDATVAVGRGGEGSTPLVGGEGRVLDEEKLGADLQGTVGSLAAMYPDGSAVGNLLRGSEAAVGHGEANLIHDIPKFGILGSVEHHLVALDGGARSAGHGVDGLDSVEEGELVALVERIVVVENCLRELADGGVGIDSESTELDAADKNVRGILGHTDAWQGAACDLVWCEDSPAVEFDSLGDIDLDHVDVGLDESVEDRHLRRQVLVAATEHRVELLVDGGEVSPLGAAVHLPCRTAWNGGLDRKFANDGSALGLAIEELAYLAADFSVYSKDFCHCFFPFFVKGFDFRLLVFSAVAICAPMVWL